MEKKKNEKYSTERKKYVFEMKETDRNQEK